MMKKFNDENFILETETAQQLYHEHAVRMPIIDYHCHLDPSLIADDYKFKNLCELWLAGDHYKWRAMRSNGVAEKYCSGDAPDREKFRKYAETVPFCMRNPIYHWTHLELKTAFGISKLLSPRTADEIYDQCNELLDKPEYSARGFMKRYNVEVVCTTDDPVDSLEHHKKCVRDDFGIKVLPTWRPDKAMAIENTATYKAYIEKLSRVSDIEIIRYTDLIEALRIRHKYFEQQGCKLSDHGTGKFYAYEYTSAEVDKIFTKIMKGSVLSGEEIEKFKTAMMYELALMNYEAGWVQQYHYGVIRNNSTRLLNSYGPDAGADSIGDFTVALDMSRFLDMLDRDNKLAKTIIYNLNPRDNALVATMIGNFQDGSLAGKMQFGSGWWFLDQKDGMEEQINTLSVLGLLSRFVGMLTDSRSFLSYSRHEYFRRTLCNILGNDIEKGLLPASEIGFIGKMVENICYYNAKDYFNF
jgi:glucuronate isomerase